VGVPVEDAGLRGVEEEDLVGVEEIGRGGEGAERGNVGEGDESGDWDVGFD